MARKVLVTQTCDYEHAEGETPAEEREARRFSLDGETYEIDLCAEHGGEYDREMDAWVERARAADPDPEPRARTARKRHVPTGNKAYNTDVRGWAKDQGIFVADRGRIPGDVIRRYEARPGA